MRGRVRLQRLFAHVRQLRGHVWLAQRGRGRAHGKAVAAVPRRARSAAAQELILWGVHKISPRSLTNGVVEPFPSRIGGTTIDFSASSVFARDLPKTPAPQGLRAFSYLHICPGLTAVARMNYPAIPHMLCPWQASNDPARSGAYRSM